MRRFIQVSLLGLGPLAAVVGVLWLAEETGPRGEKGFPPGCVYDEGPTGLSMARRFAVAQARLKGGEVRVFTGRVGLDPVPPNGVLFRIQPISGPAVSRTEVDQEPSDGDSDPKKREEDSVEAERAREEKERAAARERAREKRRRARLLTIDEENWVRGGGRLVLGLDADYGPVDLVERGGGSPRKVFPSWPGVVRLTPPGKGRGLAGAPVREGTTLFTAGDAAVLSLLSLGKGDVVLLALPEVLTNASLASADHAALLATLVGQGRPVLFDERAHGLGRDDNLLSLLVGFGLGPTLLVGCLGLLLALWRGRVRLGEPEPEPGDRRCEAVDLVESLGELYDRALSRREALRLRLEGLRRAVTLRTGLKGPALDKRVRALVGTSVSGQDGESEMPHALFQRSLAAVNEGFRRLEQHVVSR